MQTQCFCDLLADCLVGRGSRASGRASREVERAYGRALLPLLG